MSSRLVETFVTLSTLETMPSRSMFPNGGDSKTPSSPTDRSPVHGSFAKRIPQPNKTNAPKHASHLSVSSPSRQSDMSKSQTAAAKHSSGTMKTPVSTLKSKQTTTNGSVRTGSTASAKSIAFPGTPSPPSTRSASPAYSTYAEELPSSIPFFISSLHRPSTNPSWTDLDASGDFAEWTDRHQSQVTVTLWGRVDECSGSAWSSLKGKGKDTGLGEPDEEHWKVLVEWDVHLDRLEKVEASVREFQLLTSTHVLTSRKSLRSSIIPPSYLPIHSYFPWLPLAICISSLLVRLHILHLQPGMRLIRNLPLHPTNLSHLREATFFHRVGVKLV